jgi:hypothetical protein
MLRPAVTHPIALRIEPPRGGILVDGKIEHVLQLLDVFGFCEAHERFDTAVEVAVHHV